MLTDHHCHILPGIDDGADCPETSISMLAMMKAQGVERVVATPHFYAHREKSVEDYLEKRQRAFEKIRNDSPIKDIRLGAEVAVERGISEIPGIEKLAFEGTSLILMELPYAEYRPWMSEEIYNISAEYGLKIIMAHIHRYLDYTKKEDMESLLSGKAILQINNEAFDTFRQRRFVRKLIKEDYPLVFGSDAHNLGKRRPDWDNALKRISAELLEKSNKTLERYLL
ncbi:MAG: capsular polysaccharide biosynthesis protein [Ruminococcus sp.]|nr:capsular polysaccharide biosynthesis protein [Ruminococcus sp.]